MDIWLEMIRDNNLFRYAAPSDAAEIEDAEKRLGLSFADEYKTFLSTIGVCICFGHEINGIIENENLNVVSATEQARSQMELIPHSWYVIEQTHMDGIVILQDRNGVVYQMGPGMMPSQISYSLESYLSDSMTGIERRIPAKSPNTQNAVLNTDIEIKAQELIDRNMDVASEKLNHPDQVEEILQQLEKKLEKVPGVGDWLADVPAVISLIRSYISKEYKEVPAASIVAALAATLYVISPIDLIPDVIPGIGMLDDAAVFFVCWKMIHDDVDKYQEWRKQAGKET